MHAAATRPRTQLALLPDGQLLDRFVDRRDQDAFAVLVQRHGPMVLALCRRVLNDDHDTEDAFQAVFVILARKASSIAKTGSVASWLYKVSFRVALRLRAARARRRSNQPLAAAKMADSPVADAVLRELRQLLDEELSQLPEKYRAPLVLCYFQGQTNEEAAQSLRCPTGTVKIRLMRGREILRKRLVRRGVALAVTAALADALASLGQAAVPLPLVRSACSAAAGTASPAVASLARSALKSMGVVKLKVVAMALVTLGLMCLADCLLSRAAAEVPIAAPSKLAPAPFGPVSPDPAPMIACQDLAAAQE
jgi:RNA polymerase sigma factor (sigma-70 family)